MTKGRAEGERDRERIWQNGFMQFTLEKTVREYTCLFRGREERCMGGEAAG
jgi:hypothetical protein